MNARHGDILVGVAALGLVAFVFTASAEMPSGPAGFPRLIAIALLVCAVILVARALLSKKESPILFTDINWPTICLVGGLWISTAIFWLTISIGWFPLPVVLGWAILQAAVLVGPRSRCLAADLRKDLREVPQELGSPGTGPALSRW